MAHAAQPAPTSPSVVAERPTFGSRIERFTTPAGIPVWLVQARQIPMISIEVAFRAGSVFDPVKLPGTASFLASMLDEGAGDLPAHAYQAALEDIGARLNVSVDKTELSLTLDTLTEHRSEAARLLGLALQKPRLDADALERVRAAILSNLARVDESPRALLSRASGPALFGKESPYAHPQDGFDWSMGVITAEDLRAFHTRTFTRANLVVSVVGDVDQAEAAKLVDAAVAGLPAGSARLELPAAPSPTLPSTVRIHKNIPQANIMLGHLGLPRNHPDYFKLIVANEILGGGAMVSRLFKNVREAHGLAYDVRSTNLPLGEHTGAFTLSIQTDNATAQKALKLMREQVVDLQKTPVSAAELQDTQDYLIGSFPLRLDSNAKILGYLTLMQMENLGPDYVEKWLAAVRKVNAADVQNVLQTHVNLGSMALVVVGQGAALEAK